MYGTFAPSYDPLLLATLVFSNLMPGVGGGVLDGQGVDVGERHPQPPAQGGDAGQAEAARRLHRRPGFGVRLPRLGQHGFRQHAGGRPQLGPVRDVLVGGVGGPHRRVVEHQVGVARPVQRERAVAKYDRLPGDLLDRLAGGVMGHGGSYPPLHNG